MNTFSDWLMNHVSIAQYTTFSTNYGSGLYSSSFASRPLTFTSQPVMDIWNYLQTVGTQLLAPGTTAMTDGTASGPLRNREDQGCTGSDLGAPVPSNR